MANSDLPLDFLSECFRIDGPDVLWRRRPENHFVSSHGARVFNSRYSGKKAGSFLDNKKLYRVIGVKYRGRMRYILEHVVVYRLTHGDYDEESYEIDHLDGCGLNNNSGNLSLKTRGQNMQNKSKYTSNTSGVTGVSWNVRRGMWMAYGTIGGVRKTLGYFRDIERAATCRRDWEKANGFTRRHGK